MLSMQGDDGNHLSYVERLKKLDTLSQELRRQYVDMLFVYKAVVDCSAGIALDLSKKNIVHYRRWH